MYEKGARKQVSNTNTKYIREQASGDQMKAKNA